MTTTKLLNHTFSQCGVYKDVETDEVEFWSYSTKVITVKYENGKRFIECTGTYSATTRKQISWFLKEYAPDLTYYDVKKIVGSGFVEM